MYQLQDIGSIEYAIGAEKDAAGNIVQVPPDAVPLWSVSDASLATIEAAADGMSAVVKAVGPLGAFKVQCSAAFGGQQLMAFDDIQVVPSAIASFVIAPKV